MVNKTRCCVPFCNDTTSAKRVLPIFDEKVYSIWLERIGNKNLLDVDPKIVYKRYRVCDRHFSDYCRIPGSKRLKAGSLPTLHLPGFFELPSFENSIYKHGNAQCIIICSESVDGNETVISNTGAQFARIDTPQSTFYVTL